MKKINKILLFLVTVFLMASCTPEEFDLGTIDVSSEELVEGIAYTITHDADNPNIVYLTSLMDERYQALWTHPQGRSQAHKDTLKIAFPGTYKVQFGVQTRGGYVYGAETEFVIANMYTGFIENELWTFLTGGVGEEKTWRLDYGDYGLAAGPLTYCEPQTTWTEWQAGTAAIGWAPAWSDNQWIIEEADKDSRMTFSLIDGAVMTTHKVTEGVDEVGSFSLDVDNHTITTTDATILRSNNFIANATNWNKDLVILELTENQLMVGVRRTNEEGDYLYAWNFVSDEYAENYVPEDLPDPEPPYDGDANSDLTTSTSTTKVWSVNMDYPYNWQGLDGTDLNEVATFASDPEGFAFTTWAPPYDESIFSAISISLSKGGDTDGTYVIETIDAKYDGTYLIDENNNIDFGQPIELFSGVGGWLTFGTTAENTLRIIKAETDVLGNVNGLWLGQKAADKDEYLSIHLEAGSGGGADASAAIKEMLTSKVWKLDSDRNYDVATSWGAEQGPVIFSDFATWAWNPLPGEHYAAGEADVDYGDMQFNMDGTVTVNQRKRVYTYVDGDSGETMERHGSPEEGDVLDSEEVVTLTGSWSIDIDNNKLLMTVGAVHPWTCDYYVLNWGDLDIYKIEENVLILKAMRDAERSGEDAFAMGFVFVPEN